MSIPYDVHNGSYATNYWYPYYPYQPLPHRVGWVCPKCGGGYNPDVQKCWTCGNNNPTVTWNQPIYTATVTNTASTVEAEVGS